MESVAAKAGIIVGHYKVLVVSVFSFERMKKP
jgi:hypothetical protein